MLTLKPANSGGYRAYWSNGHLLGEVYREVDGYYVWWPSNFSGGCWTEGVLRCMADKLRELNAEWDQQVRRAMPTTDPVDGRNYIPFTGDKSEVPFDF